MKTLLLVYSVASEAIINVSLMVTALVLIRFMVEVACKIQDQVYAKGKKGKKEVHDHYWTKLGIRQEVFKADAKHPKYRIIEDGPEKGRIVAVRAIERHGIREGELGGSVTSYACLSQEGDCWVGENATVQSDARISGNALISGTSTVSGSAVVTDDAMVTGDTYVSDNVVIKDRAWVGNKNGGRTCCKQSAMVLGDAEVFGGHHTGYSLLYGRVYSSTKGVSIVTPDQVIQR